jgi:hypothetical protein
VRARVILDDLGVGLVLVHQVAHTHHRAADEHLAARHADVRPVGVGDLVAPLLPVLELDHGRGRGRTDHARAVVARVLRARGATRLGETVALAHGAVEGGLHEHLRLGRERRRAGAREPELAAEERLHLLEDDLVVEPRRADDALGEVGLASGHARREKLLDGGGGRLDLGVEPGVDLGVRG